MKLINLSRLESGKVINVLNGEGEDTEAHRFRVLEPGIHPVCELSQGPENEDEIIGPVRVCLEGCTMARAVLEGYNDEEITEPGDGLLYLGGVIIIFDQSETASPIPKTRRPILPPISGIFPEP